MKVLIFGATGMLGKALMKEGLKRGLDVIGAARRNSYATCDISSDSSIEKIFAEHNPSLVINAAAITNISACDCSPKAWAVNARAVSVLADLCNKHNVRFVQISTDHYFVGDKDKKHSENSQVSLVNDYARQKYAAERYALAGTKSLVIRTNVVGFRAWGEETFAQWAIGVIRDDKPAVLFDDFYTSSIDVWSCSRAVYDLIAKEVSGIVNIASREVFSKKKFIHAMAGIKGRKLTKTVTGSVSSLGPIRRAESLGLDVSLAEDILNYKLPTMLDVITALTHESQK
jgi:dTDP-4-dehydrorhamnose reductase